MPKSATPEAPRQERNKETNDVHPEALELTGDSALDATLLDIREALKERRGAIIVIGAIGAPERRREYEEAIKRNFPQVEFRAHREGGYTAEDARALAVKLEGKVVVIDAPLFYESITRIPWAGYEHLPPDFPQLRGTEASAWLRGWLQNGEEKGSVADAVGNLLETLREQAASMGRLQLALPSSAPVLALITYVYAMKSGVEWNADTAQSVLERIAPAGDPTLFLTFGDGGPGVVYNGERIV